MTDIRKDHQRLWNNLKLVQKNFGIHTLTAQLGISAGTWNNRMKEPWKKFSYDDFKAISRLAKVELDTLLSGYMKLG